MVRDKNKIYAEVNDEQTVIASNELSDGTLVVSATDKVIRKSVVGPLSIFVAGTPSIANVPNKTLGTDANGNLTWL